MTASWLGAVLASNIIHKQQAHGREEILNWNSSLQLLPDLEIVLSSRITVDRPLDPLERVDLFHF